MKKFFVVFVFVLTLFTVNINVNAQGSSYIMMDIQTKRILKGNNIHNKSLVASTAKIMTCLVGIENANLFDLVKIEKEDTLIEGSKIYVEENDEVLFLDLLYGLMLRSGNDAANAISRFTFGNKEEFIIQMNETAKKIGMKDSTFSNASGLDTKEFNLSTAYDMALLTCKAMENEHFRMITSTKSYRSKTKNNAYLWTNKHKLITGYDTFIGGKTGYTKKAGRILVSVANVNAHEVVIVTINDSNDWQTHKRLSEEVKNYKNYKIIDKGKYDTQIKEFNYLIDIEKDYEMLLTKKELDKVNVKFRVNKDSCQMIVYIENEIINLSDIKLVKKE